jgi:hypothetical protein
VGGVLARTLWDTGCSHEIISPDFADELLRRGGRWRECAPLHIEHGDVEYVKAGAPPTRQICANILLVHKGRIFEQTDVWLYVYEGCLPDVMLSENFLNDIPCVSHPGVKLFDTRESVGDRELLEQCVNDYRDLVVRRYTHPECMTSNLHFLQINSALGQLHSPTGVEGMAAALATGQKQPPAGEVGVEAAQPHATGEANEAEPANKERVRKLLTEMEAQRTRLRQRLGKPVSEEALQAAQSVLDRYPRNFREPGSDACNLAVFRIKLKDNTKFHIALPRRVNPIMLAEMRRQVEELLLAGAIERCQTTPSSVYAVVMVKKPGQPGKYRLCLDLINLNSNTMPMPYAMPDVHEALDRLSGKKYYSSFDFSAWFQQFAIADEDREKVAFIIPGDNVTPPQIYQFKKMCFGLLNAGFWSQRQLQEALEKFEGCEGIYPFVDDIVIASDTLEEHLAKLEAFMKFCEHHNIRIKKEKVELVTGAVKHLGFILSEEGQALDPARIDSLLSIGAPVNLKGLKSLLGSFSFIRGWIAGMADTAAPLTDLMGAQAKRMGFQWGKEQEDALKALKEACQLAPALGAPDYSKTFNVSMDASDVGVGAVLWQWQTNSNGETLPQAIMYASRRFSDRERRWEISCRELYAVKYALEKFKTYLQGCHDVVIHTDHLNLVTGLYSHASPKIERWRMFIESFRPFKIQHVRGSDRTQQVADGLSRLHITNLALNKTPEELDADAVFLAEQGEGGMDEAMMESHKGIMAHARGSSEGGKGSEPQRGRVNRTDVDLRQLGCEAVWAGPEYEAEKGAGISDGTRGHGVQGTVTQPCTVAHAWATILHTTQRQQLQEELQQAGTTAADRQRTEKHAARYGTGCKLMQQMGWKASDERHAKMQWEADGDSEEQGHAQQPEKCSPWRVDIKMKLDDRRRPGLGCSKKNTQQTQRKTYGTAASLIVDSIFLGEVSEGERQETTAKPEQIPRPAKKAVTFRDAVRAQQGQQEGKQVKGGGNPRRAESAKGRVNVLQETQTNVEDFRQAGRKWRGGFPDEALLKRCHDETHPSFPVTWRRVIRATGIGPGLEQAKLKDQVKRYCEACPVCQKLQPAKARVAARLGTIRQRPFGELAFDVIVLNAPDVDDNRYILTVIDSFSRAVELFPLKKASADAITICLHDVLCRWGKPHRVRCDNAKAFAAQVTRQLLQRARVKQHFCAPYSHNSNGQVENANRRVMDLLRAMILEDRLGPQTHLQWSLLLPAVRRVLMSRMVLQYGCCPNDLAYMFSPENEDSIFSEEIWMPTQQEPTQEPQSKAVETLLKQHQILIDACEQKQDEHLSKLAMLHDMQAEDLDPLQPGDFVLVDMRERPHTKISSPWSGPWQVIEEREDNETTHPMMTLQHIANKKIERFHTSMCKRCNMDLFEKLEDAIEYAAADNFEYVIEDILSHRPRGKRGRQRRDKYEFQVLWSGIELGEDNPSWEPYANESLRASEPFGRYCRREDVQEELGRDFITSNAAPARTSQQNNEQ